MLRTLVLLTALLLPSTAAAQSLAGTWVFDSPQGRVTLVVQQQGASVTGTMTGADGNVFRLEGALEEGGATGAVTVGESSGWFAMGPVGGMLKLIVAEVDPTTGEPDLSSGWELDFSPAAGAGAGSGMPSPLGAPPAAGPPAAAPGQGMQGAGPGGVPPQREDTPLLREWLGHLRGKRLTYMNSYDSGGGSGGYSDKWEADICSDGTFFYKNSSSVVVNVPGGSGYSSGNGASRGMWRIVEQGGQVALQYQMEGSAPEEALLEYRDGTTYLGGQRVFVTADNQSCR